MERKRKVCTVKHRFILYNYESLAAFPSLRYSDMHYQQKLIRGNKNSDSVVARGLASDLRQCCRAVKRTPMAM